MKSRELPELTFLRECFSYDRHTGKLFWKKRPLRHFASRAAYLIWNRRFAGKEITHVGVDGYVIVTLSKINRRAHRIIWKIVTGQEPPECLDHRDGNRTNNKWNNLRAVTGSQNATNRTLQSCKNSTGFRGVYKAKDKWRAFLFINYERVDLGLYETPEMAYAARKAAERKMYGEFAP